MLARLRGLTPLVRSLVGKVRGLAFVSGASAVVLWSILFAPWQWGSGTPLDGIAARVLLLALLLVPAAAAYVGHLMLRDLLDLPARLRATASETVGEAKDALVSGDRAGRARLFGFFRAIWAARGLLLDTKGLWVKMAATARLVRLASLPFVLGLLAAFALNFAVIGAALLAVVLVAVF